MKSTLVIILPLILSFHLTCYAQKEDNNEQEYYNNVIEGLMNSPFFKGMNFNAMLGKLYCDTIPEANFFYKMLLHTEDCLILKRERNAARKGIIDIEKYYIDNSSKFAENSLCHALHDIVLSAFHSMEGNESARVNVLIHLDMFLRKYDKNSILRLNSMPAIAAYFNNIGDTANCKFWMNETLQFLDRLGFRKTAYGLGILNEFSSYYAAANEKDKVDSLYCEITEIANDIDDIDSTLYKASLYNYIQNLMVMSCYDETLWQSIRQLEEISKRDNASDVENLLLCRTLYAYVNYYQDNFDDFENDIKEINSLCNWLLTNEFPTLPAAFRYHYWDNILKEYFLVIPSFANLIKSQELYRDIYNVQLISKGALLCSMNSFEDISRKSKNKIIKDLYAQFIGFQKQYAELLNLHDSVSLIQKKRIASIELSLENSILEEINKEGTIVDWSYLNIDSVRNSLKKDELAIEFFISREHYCPLKIANRSLK